jgi:hypothetical protein
MRLLWVAALRPHPGQTRTPQRDVVASRPWQSRPDAHSPAKAPFAGMLSGYDRPASLSTSKANRFLVDAVFGMDGKNGTNGGRGKASAGRQASGWVSISRWVSFDVLSE